MGDKRRGPQRRSAAIAALLLTTALVFTACTRNGNPRAAGWSIDNRPVRADTSVSIPGTAERLELSVVLPEGFQAADGFRQTATVSGADFRSEVVLSVLSDTVEIPVPNVEQVILTLSIGFCRIREKDVCYVDRAELVISRTLAAGMGKYTAVQYSPEDPT